MYWIFIILFLGPLGALIYIFVEALPDLGLLRQSFKVFPRRKRIHELETMVRDNPSAGNCEELEEAPYMDDGRLLLARAAFDKSIAARADTLDPFYRRGVCAIQLGDAAAALPDLERVVDTDPEYDFHRAAGLLAHAYARTGQKEKAEALFRRTTATSTLSETYLNSRICSHPRGATLKPANGRRRCWISGRRCPTTSAAGSGRGSTVHARC